MIAWNDYLNKLIEVPDTIDGIDVSFDEGKKTEVRFLLS